MNIASVLLFAAMGILFREMFVRLDIITDVRRAFRVAPEAAAVMRSADLTDLEKERQVRRMSIDVLSVTLRFTLKLLLVLAAVIGLAAVVQWLFEPSSNGLVALLTSWQALFVMIIVVPLYSALRRG